MSVDDNPVRTREAYLLPTSYGQRRLWFLDLLEPGSASSYTEHGALRITGELDVAALGAAVTAMVRRHETLRTGLVLVDGEPVQAVATELSVPVEQVDRTGRVPAGADTAAVHAALAGDIRELLRRPFDLTQPPLFRVVLYRLGPADQVLVVAFHHAVYDQWSGAVFVRELLACYDAALAGAEPELPELPVQYGDFAAWQREWVGGEEEAGQLAYWERRLAALPPLELPTDRPRPATQTFDGATVTAVLPADLVAGLDRLGREHQATLFMTVLTGFAAVLARHSGQDDLAVGTPVAGRPNPELEHLVGFFVNSLVLRVDASEDPGFTGLLDRVRLTCLDAFANADVPFERVVERLRPDRDLARSPLFSVMFVFGNVPLPALRATGITAELFRVDPGTAKFDLFVTCVPRADGGLTVTVEHNTALFDPATARRLLDHLRLVLDAAVLDPDRPLSALPLLTDAERDQLVAWGRGPAREIAKDTLPALVAARAAADPGRTAVTGASGRLGYAELVTRARRIAAALHAAGVRPGQLVGVAVDRDVDLPAALLGVLGCGAAYLPLDVALPAERLRFVLADSGAALALADATSADHLPGDLPVVRVDAELPAAADWPAAPGPDDLAYVIYTSGSTGTPKGVAVPHRALVNLLATLAERPGLGPATVLSAVTTLSFDIAALELFGPLIVGGRVDVVPRAVAADGARLAAHLAGARATVVQATPTTWRLLLAAGWRPGPDFAVWCGGEPFPADLGRALTATGASVWNLYGPTETTVWSTVYRVVGGEDPLPLGGPVANTELLVVDGSGRRVPVGVPGELWIGGAGVASGYWRREELTAGRFVGHPEVVGARVYRTGDVVRWRGDGWLEFLGRVDFQVKVRGHRIELGEIESVLRGDPRVRDAVVVVREDTPGDQRLVGYADLHHPDTVDRAALAGELHAACRDRLPDYMVPSALVLLDTLPLTANRNKVDRAKLPAPDGLRPDVGAYDAPRGDMEERLAAIFADVLGLDRVGRADDFFALGGHSLLATRVVARIRDALDVGLPVRAVFATPTVAGLAAGLPRDTPAATGPGTAAAGASTAGTAAAPAAAGAGDPVAALPPIAAQFRLPQVGGDLAGRYVLPASSGQRRLWFLAQLDPAGAGGYTVDSAVRLAGPLDPAALHTALNVVVARHETLRTSFHETDGEPVQVVAPALTVPLDRVELADPDRLDDTLTALSGAPFDLRAAPLLRATLIRLDTDQHVLHLALHHAVCDRWSVQILARDLVAAYVAATGGAVTAPPPLSVQYGDYAAWQRQWTASPPAAAQLAYWRDRLADLPALELPTDRPRPATRSWRGDLYWDRIPASLVRRVTEAGQRNSATLFMVGLAACQLALGRYSGQRDFAVGSPVAGRPRTELEGLVGFFVNNLVLRADLTGDPTVGELLDRVRATCLDAYAHADVPFDQLVEELRPVRDRAQTPLFNVLFAVQNTPPAARAMGPVEVVPVDLRPGTTQFDLSIMLIPEPDGGDLRLRVEYDAELFDPSTVDRIAAQFRLLLAELAGDPARRVGDLAPLTTAEEKLLLRDWVRQAPQPDTPGLMERFREQASRTPDEVAAECGAELLTYGQLLDRATGLAARLRAAGVGRGDRVAIHLDRGLDLLVAVLGVLAAGAAYVPLDPGWPADRMRYVLDDAGVRALVASDPVPGYTGPVLAATGEPGSGEAGSGEAGPGELAADPAADPPAEPDDVAYLIYTSGSTGRPKGVMVTHRNVVRLVTGAATRFRFTADDVWSLFHSVAFDVSVFEMWGAWLTGARVVVVPYLAGREPAELRALLARHRVTVLSQTPTAFRQLAAADAAAPDRLESLRYVVFAGEALDVRLLAGWFDRYGDARPELVNMYGTTETTVHATFHRVRAAELAEPGRHRVGRPLPDLRIVLLDADRRPVPLGAAGEVAIAGPGVSLGYAGRPELTADRFVTSPYAGPDGTLYRTGDLARWLPDGTLDFIGRTDAQVKIRGFRVEPGEVEAVLREHPDVADVVVVARAGRADDTELAGYVVPRPGAAPAPAALRAHARRLLPEYLVPASLTLLDALPRTGNGKLDVRALPRPRHGADEAGHVAPRDDLERTLADIWRGVLDVDTVGVHDNFFDLGGHSLLATRAMSRTRAALGVDAGVRDLFDQPTVAGLAERLRTMRDGHGGSPIPAVPRDGLLPVAPAQRRLWLLHQLDPDSARAYVIGSAVRLRGPLDAAALATAFADVVARHEALRTSFEVVDGEPLQRVHPELTVPVERVDLTGDPAALAALTRARLTAPFDLGVAPLVRATLVRAGADEHHLLLALHHAIGDQWSTQVVVRDLVAAYRAKVAGNAVDLAPLDLQYADVAAWQADRLDRGAHDEDLRWWTERLAGLPVLDLPTDRVRPSVRGHRGGLREAEVPARVVERLAGVGRRHDATPFMVALAAYQLMLSRYAGQTDFGVAVPVSGRDRPETEGLVGFLANTLVLRADLDGGSGVGELLGRVRETCLGAYARADVPFDVLVERLGLTRDLSRTPVAQVGFALVDRVAAEDREFAGVRAEPLPFDPGSAKTDLTVTVVPTDAGDWRLLAEYDADLFAPATVDRMLAHLAMLLAEIAEDPARPVAALPDLPAEEAAQLEAWGRGPVREVPEATWPELFVRQATATPDAPAVFFGDDMVTYAELNARANRLAHRLIALGVEADALVGVFAERSVEMVVAVLAVLKAGGAYVPIDPGYPADRVAYMIADSGARVLLTQAALTDRLAGTGATGTATVVPVDGADLADLPDTDPPRRSGPDDLAYVIYTSGSTGNPKGVAVEHRSVTNLWLTRYMAGLHEGSRVLQFAPFSFDVSVFEMVLSLLGGVPLVVPQPRDLAGGVEIVGLINRQRVTFTFIPPSLLAHLSPEHVPTLELLGSGGEDCPAEVAERWGGRKRFLIGYGPTETTVYATVTDEIVGGGHPPIGRPVVNTVVRVLDERLRLRPVGAPGELYIGGPGLARGYLHRPELTEAAFVRHPVTGERLYRTGDLVRYLPDGNLEFIGRTDDQVKLRGFRIELGEIAAALRGTPGVAESVVVVREDRPGDKRLVGYIVPDSGGADGASAASADGTSAALTEEELSRAARDAVADRLPHYMVPAAVVVLPALPLTPNGKVDRKALPAPAGPVGGTGYVPPRTPTEHRLTRLVAEALGVERVGLDDDFFALGGHSLLAARLHATIRRLWGVDLPVRVLFERSRVGALADLLDEQGSVDVAAAEAEHAAALRADVTLPEDVRPVGEIRWTDRPGTVLLTGATGFLGAYLARQLAEAGATVFCLVRGRDEADAQERLAEQLRRYRCWNPEWADRFRALPGDLAAPRLGLTPARFAALAREVDEIYHCGAVVHFLRPYAMLRDGNVAGTVEILRLATSDRPIPVHYVSTMSVFGGLARGGGDGPADATDLVLREDDLPDAPPPATDTGYNHSKWVAEQVVALARARGVPVAVYRPGRIAGDTRTGTWRGDDLVCQVIRACVRTGLVPDTGLATDLVPVDHLAAAITGLARRRDALGRTFHFALDDKVPLVRLADALTDRGWPVRRVPLDEWYAAVGEAARAGDDLLGPVLAMYAPLAEGRVTGPGEPIFDDRNCRGLLGDALPPPRVDTALLGRYLDVLVADGFIPAPPIPAAPTGSAGRATEQAPALPTGSADRATEQAPALPTGSAGRATEQVEEGSTDGSR